MNWINNNTRLNGETVDLLPLAEEHFSDLYILAKDKRIWEHIPVDMSTTEKCAEALSKAFTERDKGVPFPFVIWHKKDKRLIGATRLMEINEAHKKLEIGWTWLHPDYWASDVNPECKLLLLGFCFEKLCAIRVQLKTDENNLRSRRALEKIGATFEGILRQDMLRDNGTRRNSVFFSILDLEWKEKKKKLTILYQEKRKAICLF